MIRGTFANIRLKNMLLDGVEGGFTRNFLSGGEQTTIYDASVAYQAAGVPLVILAGKEYGSGSSRDWAAKGTQMLGVRTVIAESYERIHRYNLIGMGILPLQFLPGESAASHALDGSERFTIEGLTAISPRGRVTLQVTSSAADDTLTDNTRSIKLIVRLDGPMELATYREGGIMPAVLRRMAKQ